MSTLTDSQNIRINSLTISSIIASLYWGAGLYADEYTTTIGINASKSTNSLYNSTNKYYGPNSSSAITPTVSATLSSGSLAANPPSLAFDGNLATYWASVQQGNAATNTAYLGVDYGAGNAYAITQIVISQRQDTGAGAVPSANVQYSDNGTTWTTAYSATLSISEPITQTLTFTSAGAHRYWRMIATSAPNNGVSSYSWSIAEIAFQTVGSTGYTLVSVSYPSDVR